MSRLNTAIDALVAALSRVAEEHSNLASTQAEVVREQRVTNLIVRSQIETDPGEKARLLHEARQRMDAPSRRAAHHSL
ncbi:hypothetical protein [Arthrobacter castelli]|uniref:hypothetical protein n=1 Tax=Arthrobacter castelli TaxID=271431 RepID=UPI000425D064|nr:hypothetical protein [Arthrobacter castelli]